MVVSVPDDARLVRVEELEEVTVCDFVARSNTQMSEHDRAERECNLHGIKATNLRFLMNKTLRYNMLVHCVGLIGPPQGVMSGAWAQLTATARGQAFRRDSYLDGGRRLKSYGGSWLLHDTSCARGEMDDGLKTGVETDARDVGSSGWSLGK